MTFHFYRVSFNSTFTHICFLLLLKLLSGEEALEASQHDIQLEDGDLDELDDNFSDLSDDDGNEDCIGLEPQVCADRGKKERKF